MPSKTTPKRPWLIGASAAVLLLLAAAGLTCYFLLTPAASGRQTAWLYIDADDTADSVCAKLRPLTTPHAATAFSVLARHTSYERRVRTGRYAVEPGQPTVQLFRRVKNGHQQPLMLTLPQARTRQQLAARLSRHLMADSVALLRAMTDTTLCRTLGCDTATVVCLFIPDTYQLYWDISPQRLLERMKREHDRFWTIERQMAAQRIGLTPHEVQTLASIIDEETANTAEMPIVAGMYVNRLRQRMPLQADPTVKFALGDFSLRRIYRQMLSVDSPYNTYKHIGLPPGPIRVASVKAIDAVLHHSLHPYLYMCANADFSGTHVFAKTYNEHLRNAHRYARALNERGIK